MCQAMKEALRIERLSAFNVTGAAKRRKLNRHATRYEFPDGSLLYVRNTRREWAVKQDGVFTGIGGLFKTARGIPNLYNK